MSVKIDQALVSHFIAGSFGLGIAHENARFDPVAGTAYAELRVLQNDITPASLKHSDETDGIFRVWLRYPLDGMSIEAKQKADAIFAAFKIGTRITYEGVTVTVVSLARAPGVSADGWYSLVLSIAYRAFLSRSA